MSNQDEFEKWFQGIEKGDGTIPIPEPRDGKLYDEYVQRHGLALAAWCAALPQWVSVEERMPEKSTKRVLVLSVDKHVEIGSGASVHDFCASGSGVFTHWMPLPLPPG